MLSEKHGLEHKESLVGQDYDGATAISGTQEGVHKRSSKACLHVHCSAQCLNLVIADSVKSVTDAGNFSLLERMHIFVWILCA